MVEVEAEPSGRHVVKIGSLQVGAGDPVLIAGPCAVERGYPDHAVQVAAAGADALRACVFKPRTRPDSFQGMGAEALPLLAEARRRTGLPLVSEVLSAEDAEVLAGHVDAYQVGARSMQNFRLLEALGEIGRPVVLKRGLAATVDEWVAASEYITRRGNHQVVLCERGIRTFEPRTRNTLDLSSVVVARELSGLPVIVDPSHAAGLGRWVPPLAAAALAVGADGLLVEVHPDPGAAWSDGEQAIDLAACAEVASQVRLRRTDARRGIEEARRTIDAIDAEIIRLVDRRRAVSRSIQSARATAGGPPRDEVRERAIADRYVRGLGREGEGVSRAVLQVSLEPGA